MEDTQGIRKRAIIMKKTRLSFDALMLLMHT